MKNLKTQGAQRSDRPGKSRLDVLLVERGYFESRQRAAASVIAGEVFCGEVRLSKPGTKVSEDLQVHIRSRVPLFVSRAGHKLQYALDTFGLDPSGAKCLDVGASTGGFTDCLLQKGASRVVAIDVGYGQFAAKLRSNPQVLLLEKTNARYLTDEVIASHNVEFCQPTWIVCDVSFISLRHIVESLSRGFSSLGHWVLLFKPQFEVGRRFLGKGGRVRDQDAVVQALEAFDKFAASLGLKLAHPPIASPVAGKKSGNREILLYYVS